jgi:hypothetical protein
LLWWLWWLFLLSLSACPDAAGLLFDLTPQMDNGYDSWIY